MEFQRFNEEIVLTYRPTHEAEEVTLRYERELPGRMGGNRSAGNAQDPQRPAPMLHPPLPPHRPVHARKKGGGWKIALVIVLCVSLCAGSLGLGLWGITNFVLDNASSGDVEIWPDGDDSDGQPNLPWGDSEDDDGFFWGTDVENSGDPHIDSYRPTGSIPQLKLVSVSSGRRVLTATQVYEKVSPSTVTVLGSYGSTYSVGTGIIFTSDGYIMTNFHVIAGCMECTVWVTNEYGADVTYTAQFVGGDEQKDLAVLKIDATGLPAAEFGVSADLSVGDTVYAIGNPLGTELRGTFTDGIVSAVDRNVEVDGVTMTLVQTNAALNSGNSGGPLINAYGQVIGINTIKMMSGEDTIEGLGFAIPTSHAVRWINEILKTGSVSPSPILGLSVTNVPVTLPDGTMGLEVVEVVDGLSAYHAGVQVGDVVVGFNGAQIRSTDDIYAERITLSVGDVVTIRVYRDGKYLDLTMTMMAQN